MLKNIRLLIVEDNLAEQNTWTRQLEQHNAIATDSGTFTFGHTFSATKEEALKQIEQHDFDAAIVDLGLANPAGHKDANTNGNDVVLALTKSELAIVVIFTGQPTDALSIEIRGPKVEVISKGASDGQGTEAVMKVLTRNAPMILTIRAAEEVIKKEMASLFHKSIWPRWKLWLDGTENSDAEITAAVSRHLTSHVHATLLEKGGQKVLAEEWYFVPPIRDGLRTGDLVEETVGDQATVAIVITPRCDMAGNPGNKNETYQLATCQDISAEWNKRLKKRNDLLSANPNEDDQKAFTEWKANVIKAKESLRSLIQHQNSNLIHFLHQMRMPDGTSKGPYMIRFDKVKSISRDSEEGRKLATSPRIASVAPEFLPSIVERLGTYFSRIGTPDYSFTDH